MTIKCADTQLTVNEASIKMYLAGSSVRDAAGLREALRQAAEERFCRRGGHLRGGDEGDAVRGDQDARAPAGGPAPLIATWLFAQYGSAYAVAFYILVCAVLTLVATSMMTDYTGKDIEGEYE